MDTKLHRFSAGGVIIHEGKVLLIKSPIRDAISFPKGTIDEGESIEQTAVREVKEETGYDTIILDNLGDTTFEFDWTDGKHYIKTVTFFLMKLANDNKPKPDLQHGEDFENYWVDIDRAFNELTYDDAKDMLKRAVQNPKFTDL